MSGSVQLFSVSDMEPISLPCFHFTQNTITKFCCNWITNYQISARFCQCHKSTVGMTKAKISKNHFILSFHKNKWKWRWIRQWHLLEDKGSWQELHFVALISVHKWLLCSTQLYRSKYIGGTGHVNLVAITGTIILVPYLEAKSLQLIWRLGTTLYDLQMSCRNLTSWESTMIVAPAMVARVTCSIELKWGWCETYTWKILNKNGHIIITISWLALVEPVLHPYTYNQGINQLCASRSFGKLVWDLHQT